MPNSTLLGKSSCASCTERVDSCNASEVLRSPTDGSKLKVNDGKTWTFADCLAKVMPLTVTPHE
jgi:hypothetical protein